MDKYKYNELKHAINTQCITKLQNGKIKILHFESTLNKSAFELEIEQNSRAAIKKVMLNYICFYILKTYDYV